MFGLIKLFKRKAKKEEQRSFAGATTNRLTFSLPQSSQSINADLDYALPILRSRARNLCANNEYGRRFLTLVKNNVIGPRGPALQVRRIDRNNTLDRPINNTIEAHWLTWSRRCDVTGKLSLPLLLRIAISSVARDGETLIRKVRGSEYPYGYALQLLEADRLDDRYSARLSNGNMIRQGVEIDSRMRPVAYYVLTSHPGDNWVQASPIRERVPAQDMFHLFLPERAEQLRGYSWFHAILNRANMQAGYEEAALVAARVGAAKMGILTRKEEGPGDVLVDQAAAQNGNTIHINAEPGEFMDLSDHPGVELSSWDPDYPHQNFDSFLNACLRGLSAGLDVATHNLSGNMKEVNYSSARIAELSERDVWVGLQEWFIVQLLMPVYEDWLATGLLRGDIAFLKSKKPVPAVLFKEILDSTRFQGRRWDWVDPLKEAQAAQVLIENGLASRTEITASKGREFEDIADELRQESEILKTANPAPRSMPPAKDDETEEVKTDE